MSCCRAAGVHVFCVGLCVKVGNLEEIPSACSKYETIIMKCRQSFILTPLCLMLWITKNIVKGICIYLEEPSSKNVIRGVCKVEKSYLDSTYFVRLNKYSFFHNHQFNNFRKI